MIQIVSALPGDLEDVRSIFKEYAASLPFSLDFQDFENEVAGLPGEYGPPSGALLLARSDEATSGCVALRRIDLRHCEMKRLFVRAAYRGLGIGSMLVRAIIAEARVRRYERMRLDTTPTMRDAQALYRAFGFSEIPPYRGNPISGTLFMELDLGERLQSL